MISVREADGFRIASIVGDVDVSNVDLIRESLKHAARGAEKCIVSLERCNYCDTTGIAMLIGVRSDIESGIVAVVPDGSNLRRVLALTGFDRVVLTVDTVDGAIRQMRRASEDSKTEPDLKIYV